MKKRLFGRLLVCGIMASLVGCLFGSGVAFAFDYFKEMAPGWNTLESAMYEDPYYYMARHNEWMNASETQVDLDDTRYWNGSGGELTVFKLLYAYDEYGYDTTWFYNYDGMYVRNVSDWAADTNHTMDQLTSVNNNVVCQQNIRDSGWTYADYMVGTNEQ